MVTNKISNRIALNTINFNQVKCTVAQQSMLSMGSKTENNSMVAIKAQYKERLSDSGVTLGSQSIEISSIEQAKSKIKIINRPTSELEQYYRSLESYFKKPSISTPGPRSRLKPRRDSALEMQSKPFDRQTQPLKVDMTKFDFKLDNNPSTFLVKKNSLAVRTQSVIMPKTPIPQLRDLFYKSNRDLCELDQASEGTVERQTEPPTPTSPLKIRKQESLMNENKQDLVSLVGFDHMVKAQENFSNSRKEKVHRTLMAPKRKKSNLPELNQKQWIQCQIKTLTVGSTTGRPQKSSTPSVFTPPYTPITIHSPQLPIYSHEGSPKVMSPKSTKNGQINYQNLTQFFQKRPRKHKPRLADAKQNFFFKNGERFIQKF